MKLVMKLNSLYICVKNMSRALSFYKDLFDIEPLVEDDIFSVFQISNFRFCLFNNGRVNEDVTWGDNCLPSFEVNDINTLLDKLKTIKAQIVFPLAAIKDNYVLEFKDSEGNDIEVYSKIKRMPENED